MKALDDILITRGPCQFQPLNAKPQQIPSSLINCSFEGTFCNWKNDLKNTKLNWTLNNG